MKLMPTLTQKTKRNKKILRSRTKTIKMGTLTKLTMVKKRRK
jgi:hypothetical protein